MLRYRFNNLENIRRLFLLVFIVVLSFSSFVLTFSAQGIYSGLWSLPLFFCIFSVLFSNIYNQITLSHIVVIIMMILRYVISPLLLYVEKYPQFDKKYFVYDSDVVFLSLFIMILEMLIIFIELSVNDRKRKKINNEQEFIINNNSTFARINPASFMLIIITVTLFLIFPSLTSTYKFVFSKNLDAYLSDSTVENLKLPFGVNWLGYVLGEVTRFVIIEWLLVKLYLKHVKTGGKIYWIISILIISINAMFTTDRIALGLMLSLVFYSMVYRLYPDYRKKLNLFIIICGFVSILTIVYSYLGFSINTGGLAHTIECYVGGYREVYQSISAYNSVNLSVIDRIEMFFVGDGISKVVILSSFLRPSLNSSDIYNYYLNQTSFNSGRVVPMISQSAYYFSIVLSPIVSYICMRLMNKFESKASYDSSNMSINLYASLIFAVAPFMYSFSVLIHVFTNVILPLWAVSKINTYFVLKNPKSRAYYGASKIGE